MQPQLMLVARGRGEEPSEEEGFDKLLPANKADHLCHRTWQEQQVFICP